MITDNDIKRQKIINLERSIGMHILNKSPIEKIQEIRNKIIELKNKIRREENYCYYSAFRTGDMKQTYAKDEGEVPFTLEGLQKIWDAIYKKRKLKKEKRMKLLILEGLYGENKGKKRQWRLKNSPYRVGDIVVLNCLDWKVIKVVEKEKGNVIIKNNKTGKHYKIEMGGKVKVGDKIMILNDKEYLYNRRFEYCEVVEVLEAKKKKLDPFIEKRRFKGNVFPKGAVFSEFASKPLKWLTPDFQETMKLLTEKPNTIFFYHRKAGKNTAHKIIMEEKKRREKQALSELRKRPYFKTTVEEVKGKPQGKENLEKIKFPCWCEYKNNGEIFLGEINSSYTIGSGREFILSYMGQQGSTSIVKICISLKDLVKAYDIEILKGELKLFKEVGEYTK